MTSIKNPHTDNIIGKNGSILKCLLKKFAIPIQIYKDIAPNVRAFTQFNSRLFLSAKDAHANKKPLVVFSVIGAEEMTANIPPMRVIGIIDINASLIAFKWRCELILLAIGNNLLSTI